MLDSSVVRRRGDSTQSLRRHEHKKENIPRDELQQPHKEKRGGVTCFFSPSFSAALPLLSGVLLLSCALVLPTGASAATSRYYTWDGTGNNVKNPNWGAMDQELRRFQVPKIGYSDNISALGGVGLPSPREISTSLILPNYRTRLRSIRGATDYLTYVGQFYDHDLDLNARINESAPIPVPRCDAYFDPDCLGTVQMEFERSYYNTSTPSDQPRQQINTITSYLDGSVVYGSGSSRAAALRSFVGGKLRSVDEGYGEDLPWNLPEGDRSHVPMANDAGREATMKAAGDVRANVVPPILALQTVFLREHNRKAAEIAAANPLWRDEDIYQEARRYTVALLQAICFYEYVPALGIVMKSYAGYNDTVDASIDNFFSTVSYRYGHSEVGPVVLHINDDGTESAAGHQVLHQHYFQPAKTLQRGVEPILRGMAQRLQNEVKPHFDSAIQHYLFGDPGEDVVRHEERLRSP